MINNAKNIDNDKLNTNLNSVKLIQQNQSTKVNFQEIFKATSLKFSNHALERLEKRKIVLTLKDLEKLNQAVEKAKEKGSRETLILMDNLALIVSIKNQTVITAIDKERLKENVFTNIDSAIIT